MKLTHYQTRILQLLSDGHKLNEVARCMNEKYKDVQNHLYYALLINGCRSSHELVKYATQKKIIN